MTKHFSHDQAIRKLTLILSASILVTSTAHADTLGSLLSGYTGYQATVSAGVTSPNGQTPGWSTGTLATLTSDSTKSLPIGTLLRVQQYINFPSDPTPNSTGPYKFGAPQFVNGQITYDNGEEQIPNIVVAIDSIDAGLKCFETSGGKTASVEAGKTVLSFVPNNSPANSGMPLDMVCQLTSPLDAGKSVSVKTTLTVTNKICFGSAAALPLEFIRRVSAALPAGYMDESTSPADFTDSASPMRPC